MRFPIQTALATTIALAATSAHAQQGAPDAAPAAGTMIGRVVDDARCAPFAGALVRLDGTGAVDTTDATGRFRFASVPAGARGVTGQKVDYEPATWSATVEPGALAYAELRLRPQLLGAPGSTAAASPAPRVTTVPVRPTQGSLFRLRVVMPDDGDAPAGDLTGELAGEPLHFTRTAARSYEALTAAPLDAPDTLALLLGAAGAGGTLDTSAASHRVPIPIARGAFPVERLRVAPRFGREPDLALAERLERESERARDVGCRAHQTPRLWTGPFARPRPGRVTSAFGRGREYNGTVTSRHTGTDFAGATGAPVAAANRGVVRLVDRFYLGGNVVYLDHGAGVVSAYMHLSQTAVAVGDTVARGQVIGRVGSTGRVTGPHLHWVVRYGRISVNPLSVLSATERQRPR